MPELPEIHRFADLINSLAQQGLSVTHVRTSTGTPSIETLVQSFALPLSIAASARGKQMQLTLHSVDATQVCRLVFGFGLVGNFAVVDADNDASVRITFTLSNGRMLVLRDSMKMASWNVAEDFDRRKRGADPVDEHELFVSAVHAGIRSGHLRGEIGAALLDQQYFNGVGNYLRAELLHCARIYPLDAIELVAQQATARFDHLLKLCREMPLEIMRLGLNKYGTDDEKRRFADWQQVYDKGHFVIDKSKRKIFMSPTAVKEFKLGAASTPAPRQSAPPAADGTSLRQLQTDITAELDEQVQLSADDVAALLLLVRGFAAQQLLTDDETRVLKRSLLALSSGGDANSVALGAWRGILDAFDVARDRSELVDSLHELTRMRDNRGVVDGSALGFEQLRVDIVDDAAFTFSSSNNFYARNAVVDDEDESIEPPWQPSPASAGYDLSALLKDASDSWWQAMREEFEKPYVAELQTRLEEEAAAGRVILPHRDQVFNAFRLLPLDQVRCVILGQDPYPAQCADGTPHAMGLAFSVHPSVHPLPGSLANIFEELHNDIPGFQKPPTGDLSAWARRGVLLLNTALTVRAGSPNAHSTWGWQQFTDEVIRQLCLRGRDRIVFILWGRNASQKIDLIRQCSIDKQRPVIQCAHPSPLSARSGFFGSRCFSAANNALIAAGEPPIDWLI